MSDLALMAATEWAKANAATGCDPVIFGHKVALVYRAAQSTVFHGGDETATAASLTALSVRPEVLQAIAQLALLTLPCTGVWSQTAPAGAEG